MTEHERQCVYKGKVLIGTFEITREGSDESISVRYRNESIQATLAGLPADVVASTLLRELVTQHAVQHDADRAKARSRR